MNANRFELERSQLLASVRLPGHLNRRKTGFILGFHEDAISFLAEIRLLKPLGDPPKGSPLWFWASEILDLAQNRKWLDRATKAVRRGAREPIADED
jgi:hypothetical protein